MKALWRRHARGASLNRIAFLNFLAVNFILVVK
jgi:hypothetical protein